MLFLKCCSNVFLPLYDLLENPVLKIVPIYIFMNKTIFFCYSESTIVLWKLIFFTYNAIQVSFLEKFSSYTKLIKATSKPLKEMNYNARKAIESDFFHMQRHTSKFFREIFKLQKINQSYIKAAEGNELQC